MVSALDTGPDGNSYNDLTELATILGDDIRAAAEWESADPDDQARAAITATLMIDAPRYEGTPSDDPPTQTRAFPRDGLTDRYGTTLADVTTPGDVKLAHALLSYELLIDPDLAAQISSAATAIKRVKADTVEVEKFAPGAFAAITRFPPRVQDLLAPFFAGSDSATTSEGGAFGYGTCKPSSFDDCDTYRVTGGLP